MKSSITNQRIAAMRHAMTEHDVDVVIVPSADPHMSEYLPEYWQGRAWLSGFTGSVGTLVVGHDFAHLWADSRYWLQAEHELAGTDIMLKKAGLNNDYAKDVLDELRQGDKQAPFKVAIDGAVLNVQEYERLRQVFGDQASIITSDLLLEVWTDRPNLPMGEIYCHAAAFVAVSVAEKIANVRRAMAEHQADFHLISTLDDIAYLTNLRGQDVACNPVFLAHCLISQSQVQLFVDAQKLNEQAHQALLDNGIEILPYDAITTQIGQVHGKILMDCNKVAVATIAQLPADVSIVRATNPSTQHKAIKNDEELSHIQEAMRQDGAALCEFFSEFERLIEQQTAISELDIAQMLTAARAKQPNYVGASFDTIAGFAGNGAIVHYKAKPDNYRMIEGDGLLLIDSGAQYQNGTTDITRMVGVGVVDELAKADVTYVLKAHIALAQAVFPNGISSIVLDAIARAPLWQAARNYGHGTGHGVGYFLNVHEPTQVIAYSAPMTADRIIKLGMVTSNEPGLYRADKWGVRIENLVACVPMTNNEFDEFVRFHDLTLCPIDTRIILPDLLNENERAWLNDYHQRVHDELAPRVSGAALAWLVARTRPI